MTKELLSQFADAKDVKELLNIFKAEMEKATQTTGTTEEIIQIDYDDAIKTRLISEAPFLRFLESKGRVQTSTSSTIGWRNKENKAKSEFIPEIGDIPEYGGKEWAKDVEHMKTLVYRISVSKMAQLGNSVVDLVNDDRQDGYADIAARKDKALLLGDTNTDPNAWNGIHKQAENKDNISGETITMDTVDDMIDQVIGMGGNPDAIVTTARVARQLTREQQGKEYKIDKVEFVPGGWVRSYYTPNGEVPIITDRNLVTYNSDGSVNLESMDTLTVVDSSAVINKNLLPISEFPYPGNPLIEESVLATFTAFGIPEPQKLGVIEGIGASADNSPISVPKGSLNILVEDDSNNPLDNIPVKLLDGSKNILNEQNTNATGITVFSNIDNGDYYIRINKQNGYETFEDKAVTVDGTTDETAVLVVE